MPVKFEKIKGKDKISRKIRQYRKKMKYSGITYNFRIFEKYGKNKKYEYL